MLNSSEWTTNARGLLTHPNVHDGHLTEVCYKMSTVTIKVNVGERSIVFTLHGVEEANISVWAGSIVSEIIIYKIGNLSSNYSEKNEIWSCLFRGQLFNSDLEVAAEKIVARSPDSYIFVLLCSYGATLACVTDTIRVSEA